MSKQLVEQIRKQREVSIPLSDRLKLTGRRPTDLQMVEIQRQGRFGDLGQNYVIGWDGFLESDVVGGGGSDRIRFDPDLWAEFYADHPEYWEKIADAIMEAYRAHAAALEASAKN